MFTICLYFKPHELLSHCIIPFCFPPAPDRLSERFYFTVFSLPFAFSLSQPGLYSLLLLICFTHPLRIIFFTVDISYSLFAFLQYSYSCSTFIKLHSAVVANEPAVVFLQFLLLLVQYLSNFTSNLIVYNSFSYPNVPVVLLCFAHVLNCALSISSPRFYLSSYQFSSLLPHNKISPSFSHLTFPSTFFIISVISLHIYQS